MNLSLHAVVALSFFPGARHAVSSLDIRRYVHVHPGLPLIAVRPRCRRVDYLGPVPVTPGGITYLFGAAIEVTSPYSSSI